jgi:DNA polymerase-1
MILIVDCSNVAYSTYHALHSKLQGTPGDEITLYGLLRTIIMGMESYPIHAVFLCFDHPGQCDWRKQVYPEYKANRAHPDPKKQALREKVQGGLGLLRQLSTAMPWYTAELAGEEADDVIGGLCQQYCGCAKTIISGDDDILQLVDQATQVYQPTKKTVIDEAAWAKMVTVRVKDGENLLIPRERYLAYRMLVGDTSDNIKGIKGVGKVTAAKMLAIASLQEIMEKPATVAHRAGIKTWKSVGSKLQTQESADILHRNQRLMDLRARAVSILSRLYVQRGQYDRGYVQKAFEMLKYQSLMNKISLFDSFNSYAK